MFQHKCNVPWTNYQHLHCFRPIKLVVAKCWESTPSRNYLSMPRAEPVRPIDPGAWVAHTAAVRGNYFFPVCLHKSGPQKITCTEFGCVWICLITILLTPFVCLSRVVWDFLTTVAYNINSLSITNLKDGRFIFFVHALPLTNKHFSEEDPYIDLPPESFVNEPFIVSGQSKEYLLDGLFYFCCFLACS